MTVEKFVDSGSIDPMYYDASYFVAPDGKAGATSMQSCGRPSRRPAKLLWRGW